MKIINIAKDTKELINIMDMFNKYMIENNIYKNPLSTTEFFNYIHIADSFYMDNKKAISFKILEINDIEYLLYVANNCPEEEERFLSKMKSCNYDSSNLSKTTFEELYLSNNVDSPKFIINKEQYI